MCILPLFMLFVILLKYILLNFTRPVKNMPGAYLTSNKTIKSYILDFVLF